MPNVEAKELELLIEYVMKHASLMSVDDLKEFGTNFVNKLVTHEKATQFEKLLYVIEAANFWTIKICLN